MFSIAVRTTPRISNSDQISSKFAQSGQTTPQCPRIRLDVGTISDAVVRCFPVSVSSPVACWHREHNVVHGADVVAADAWRRYGTVQSSLK